jgi:hypothetical protein
VGAQAMKKRTGSNVSVYGDADGTSLDAAVTRRIEQLWFGLARRKWSSVVLVPVDADGSAATIARSLAAVGNRMRDRPVTAVVADSIDYGAALALVDLQSNGGTRRDDAVEVEAFDGEPSPDEDDPVTTRSPDDEGTVTGSPEPPDDRRSRDPDEDGDVPDPSEPNDDRRRVAGSDETREIVARALPPSGQVIFAVKSVLAEPLGIAVAHAADGAILCIEMEHTPAKAVRRTIELIGREHVIGCILIPARGCNYR